MPYNGSAESAVKKLGRALDILKDIRTSEMMKSEKLSLEDAIYYAEGCRISVQQKVDIHNLRRQGKIRPVGLDVSGAYETVETVDGK